MNWSSKLESQDSAVLPMCCKTVEELEHIQMKKTERLSSRITYIFLYEELVIFFKKSR